MCSLYLEMLFILLLCEGFYFISYRGGGSGSNFLENTIIPTVKRRNLVSFTRIRTGGMNITNLILKTREGFHDRCVILVRFKTGRKLYTFLDWMFSWKDMEFCWRLWLMLIITVTNGTWKNLSSGTDSCLCWTRQSHNLISSVLIIWLFPVVFPSSTKDIFHNFFTCL